MQDDEHTELLINKARYLLQYMEEYETMHKSMPEQSFGLNFGPY